MDNLENERSQWPVIELSVVDRVAMNIFIIIANGIIGAGILMLAVILWDRLK